MTGPGISQRAAAARTQTVWRWLVKPQASSLTAGEGYYRMDLERNNMDKEINDRSVNPLIRIADALEEILRLVKQDMDRMKKINEEN